MNGRVGSGSLSELSEQLRSGEISCYDVAVAVLQQIHQRNPQLNCFLNVFDGTARERALELDRELLNKKWRGPLHGVPIAIKDIFDFPDHMARVIKRVRP